MQELQNLFSVAVVDADNKIAFRTVTMGPRTGSLWVVETGLKGDERVVVAGLQRVREGMVVSAKPAPPEPEGTAAGPAAGER